MLLPSIRSLKTGSLLLATLAVAALPVLAGETYTNDSKDKNPVIEKPPTEPRFWMDLMGSGEFDIHATHFVSNGTANFGINSVEPGLNVRPLGPLPALIESRDFQSTHDIAATNGRLELGYKVLPYLSVFAGGTYSHSSGNSERPLGYVTDVGGAFGVAGGRYDLFAGTGQYQSFSGIAGIKLNTPRTLLDLLHIPKAIKPYAALSAGGKYVDNQYIRFYNGATDGVAAGAIVNTGRLHLYDASWVGTFEAQLGYDLQLTRNISINLEDGYGYDTKPERGALPINFSGTNNGGNRLYSTVSLGMKLSF